MNLRKAIEDTRGRTTGQYLMEGGIIDDFILFYDFIRALSLGSITLAIRLLGKFNSETFRLFEMFNRENGFH